MKDDTKVKCSKARTCKWKGVILDLKDKKTEVEGVPTTLRVCPECGNDEFYEV